MKVANSLGFKTNHTLESPRELVLTNTVFPHLTKIEVVIRFTHPPQIEMNPEKNIKSNGFRHWKTLISERRNSDKDEPLIVLACYPEAVSRPQCKAVELKQSSEVSLCREDRGQSFGRPWRRGRLHKDRGQRSGDLQKGPLESWRTGLYMPVKKLPVLGERMRRK